MRSPEKLPSDARHLVRLLFRDRDTLVFVVHVLAHLAITFGLLGVPGKRECKYAADILRIVLLSVGGGAVSVDSRVVAFD